jgi:hypothetical protein
MKVWRILIATPMVLLTSRALVENWVTVATQNNLGHIYSVDKDSIRRGDDGLVYFRAQDELSADHVAADCPRTVFYVLDTSFDGGKDPMALPDWRNSGKAVESGSTDEAELQYACANAG